RAIQKISPMIVNSMSFFTRMRN
ncbi:unnamed protein product, partial [Allacma fusca]